MSEKDSIYKGKIIQKGVFNFKDVYEFLYDYLVDENYDVSENKYVEKLQGDTKNLEIIWSATKEVSDYFKFEITATWSVLGLKKVKVKKEDQELVMDSGSIEIKFTASIIKDYENRWENNPALKFMRGLYDRYIIRSRIDTYEVKIWDEVNEIVAQTKSFLAIEGQHKN
jgi:enolase